MAIRSPLASAAIVVSFTSFLAPAAWPMNSDDDDPQQEHQFEAEEISGEREDGALLNQSLTAPSIALADEALKTVPGATTLITADQFRQGQAANLADVLSLSPSVYIQSRHGGGETRLSVRGSGIRQTFNAIGVQVLRNGLPLSEADTNVRPQLISPLDIMYAEVLPGANGLIYGSATLGGAINFVTATGRTAEGIRLRSGVGAFSTNHTQFSAGHVLDNGDDFYLSYSQLDQDGFRDHAEESFKNIYGNYGFRHNENWETRVHVTRQDSQLLLPGSLTEAQIDMDPTVASGLFVTRDSKRDFEVTRFDVQTSGRTDDVTNWDFGVSYQDLEMFHPLPFGGAGGSITKQDRMDIGANIRFNTMTEWFGAENEFYSGVFYGTGEDESDRFDITGGAINRSRESESSTTTVYMEDRIRVGDKTRLVVGAALVSAKRDRKTTVGAVGQMDDTFSQINPKLGFLYDTDDSTQVFGNVSSSFEPPTEGNLENSVGGNLEAQSAWTVELGARSKTRDEKTTFMGAVYYSMVDDELLTVEFPVGSGLSETGNADETIHAGIELAVGHDVPTGENNVHLQCIANYNRFNFEGDTLFNDNEIPGIPKNVIRADAIYECRSGFYVGVNAQYASSWFVDFTNSRRADSFLIYGAKAGYNSGGNWNAYLEIRNLTDEKYASNSGIATDVAGADTGILNPGSPFAMFAGVEIVL